MTNGVVSGGGAGVDLRLRRISSSPSQTLRRRLVRTTDDGRHGEWSARRRPSRLYFSHFATRTVYNAVDLYAAIFVQNRVFCLPHLHLTPPLEGFPSEYRHPVWYGKARMVKNFEDIFIRLTQLTNMTDRRTDGRTPHAGIYRAYA